MSASCQLAVQLYSVRRLLPEDPRGTLAAIAGMGYAGVEFFGPMDRPAEEWAGLLAETGLACCGWHVPWAAMQPDALEETIAYQQVLGNPNLVVPGIPAEARKGLDDWRRVAGRLDEVAGHLRPLGLRTGYHNHRHEFAPLEGERPWDLVFRSTGPDVIMQIDTGNCRAGGGDPVAVLERYPGRARTVHAKPYDARLVTDDPHAGFATMIGEDDTPWREVVAACRDDGGTEWLIVEYESDRYEPLDAVERCLAGLRDLL